MLNFLRERKVILILALIVALVAIFFIVSKVGRTPEEPVKRILKTERKSVIGELDIHNAFIEVAETVGPTVVSISTQRTQKFKMSPFPFERGRSPFRDEFFDDFFKDFFRGLPEEYERRQMGLGSGVIIDEEGYILTNDHVVSGAEKITVALADGRKFEGKVKGSDPKSDLAIIQIDAKDLPVAVLGNSDFVQTGEWVVAIGNPFGYLVDSPEPTVTAGVVSALHRSLPSRKSGYLDLIQTDAAINPGNSGGPLCDLEGNVIGINVAIFSTTGGYQGVGFAIPINLAKSILGDLIKGKKVAYGWMGVMVQEITEDLARYFNLTDKKGVLVARVIKESPAYKAGLKEGDIIKEFDSRKINTVKDILVNVSRIPIGKKVKVMVLRDGKKISFVVEVGRMPSDEELARLAGRSVGKVEKIETEKWRGLIVSAITTDLAERFNISDREGMVILDVEQGSPASYSNLRQGDVIRRINTKHTKTIEDYREAVKDLKGDVLVYTDKGFTIVKDL